MIIPPNTLHAVFPDDRGELIYDTFVFNQEMLGSLDNDRCAADFICPLINGSLAINSHLTKAHQYYGELKTTAENIISCAKGNTANLDLLLKSELLRLFWLLETSGDIYPKTSTDPNRCEAVRPAIEYIEDNFGEEITVDMLSGIAHLSKSYFMSLFKQASGVGAMEYVSQLRIAAAKKMLSETDKGIAEIAYECGFRNLSNFNRQFKNRSGLTPKEYRKSHSAK